MKILASTATLIGGGIGVPIYFVATSVTPTKLTRFIDRLSEGKSQALETVTKMSCTSQDLKSPTVAEAHREFIKEQAKNEELYSYVTCSDAGDHLENKSLLGGNWEALFPKDVLSKNFSPIETTGEFSVNVKSSKNREDIITTFSNIEGTPSVIVRWNVVTDTPNFSSTTTIKALIEEGSYQLKEVYFLLDLIPKTEQGLGHS